MSAFAVYGFECLVSCACNEIDMDNTMQLINLICFMGGFVQWFQFYDCRAGKHRSECILLDGGEEVLRGSRRLGESQPGAVELVVAGTQRGIRVEDVSGSCPGVS